MNSTMVKGWMKMISRRTIQTVLGLVWFIDGSLQLKPQMFTQGFIKQVILPTAEGQPHWISALVNWGAELSIGHITLWNAAFAAVQLLLGLAFILNVRTKAAIVASVIWSAIVWVFGEGFGQILTGQSLLLTGAPGAALIYGIVAIAIWVSNDREPSEWSARGIRFAQLSLAALFILGCVLDLQGPYRSPDGLSQAIGVPWIATMVGHQAALVSFVLALIELAIAVMLIFRFQLRVAAWASVGLSLAYWWVGQSFGQIFEPLSTDFNSGLLMVILALCSHPQKGWSVTRTEKDPALRKASA